MLATFECVEHLVDRRLFALDYLVRDGFGEAVQSDLKLQASQTNGGVIAPGSVARKTQDLGQDVSNGGFLFCGVEVEQHWK